MRKTRSRMSLNSLMRTKTMISKLHPLELRIFPRLGVEANGCRKGAAGRGAAAGKNLKQTKLPFSSQAGTRK
jgi:hypothetical protein